MNKLFSVFKKSKENTLPKPASESAASNPMQGWRGLLIRISFRERILFIKQLSILIRAGIPLLSSLHMLKKQGKSRSMGKVLNQVISDVENGHYLATALGKFKKLFGELTVNIIAVGEISGTLTNNLDHLALTLKKQNALRNKVISASIYPAFIVVATLAITVMLTVFFFPKIVPVFKSVNYDLPWTTKFLIFLSDTVRFQGWYIVGAVVLVAVGGFFLLRIPSVRFWYSAALLRLPFVKKFIVTYNTTNIARTLGLLLNGGVTVVRSFQITANTTPNVVYKKKLNLIAEEIMKGEKISSQVGVSGHLFNPMVAQMVEVGESTGKLSETFLYLADVYEEEMDELTKNISTAVEPILLIFMGVLVGFIAISVITPIYGITQHLNPK